MSIIIDKNKNVLVEKTDKGWATGYTNNFIKVKFKTERDLNNKIVKVKIVEIDGQQAQGQI